MRNILEKDRREDCLYLLIKNADCNGAIGMLRKENIIRDADCVSLLDRGDIVAPVVVNVRGFCLPKHAVRKDFID